MVDLEKQKGGITMPVPIQFTELTSTDMQDPTLSAFNQQLKSMAQSINSLMGFNGPVQIAAPLDLQGNTIKNVGQAQSDNDVVTMVQANRNYGAAAVAPQLESTGNKILQTTRRLNDTTQREQSTTYLNDLLSAAPKSNTINPIINGSLVTIPASIFQFSDGSKKVYPGRSDTLSPPASYGISSWSVTSGVATVYLSSTPSPALVAGNFVYVSGTGSIDGAAEISNIISPTSFQFNTTGTGSGTAGNVQVGGSYYYYIEKSIPQIKLQIVASGADTPFNRLSVSGDQKQLVAVVQTNSSGISAGGGTPTNTANAGAFF